MIAYDLIIQPPTLNDMTDCKRVLRDLIAAHNKLVYQTFRSPDSPVIEEVTVLERATDNFLSKHEGALQHTASRAKMIMAPLPKGVEDTPEVRAALQAWCDGLTPQIVNRGRSEAQPTGQPDALRGMVNTLLSAWDVERCSEKFDPQSMLPSLIGELDYLVNGAGRSASQHATDWKARANAAEAKMTDREITDLARLVMTWGWRCNCACPHRKKQGPIDLCVVCGKPVPEEDGD